MAVPFIRCERADLRPTPTGIAIYTDERELFEALPPPAIPRTEVIDVLYQAVMFGEAPVHSGEWGRATTEVCLAILESARTQADYYPSRQVGVANPGGASLQ